MKKWCSICLSLCLLLQLALVPTLVYAQPLVSENVITDGDKRIAKDIVIGDTASTITATFTLKDKGSLLNEGIGFYYQDGDGSPAWSFYRITLWRDVEKSDRVDFYAEKQYGDKWVGFVNAKVNGETESKERYVSVDYGWNAAEETAFTITVTVDPTAKTATATLLGAATRKQATILIDLSQAATGEKTPGELASGKVFLRLSDACDYSNFSVTGYNGEQKAAGNVKDADIDTTKTTAIVDGITLGSEKFTVEYTIVPRNYEMNHGLLLYYHNGDGTPPWSFYRLTLMRETATDSGRLDFFVEKQYNDQWKGFVFGKVNEETTTKERYVSRDYGWDTSAEEAFQVKVTVDPAAHLLVATVTGVTSSTSATLTVDLTTPGTANGDTAENVLTTGGVGMWFNKPADYYGFSVTKESAAPADPVKTIDTSKLPAAVSLNIDPSAEDSDVYVDGTKTIVKDLTLGKDVFRIRARLDAVDSTAEYPLYTTLCLGFAYQNGDGAFGSNPNFSFYQFRMETKGQDNNAFIQLQKQVNDTDFSRIKPVSVDGEGTGAAADGYYVTADNGWDTNAEQGFYLTATVDLVNQVAICELEGVTTGKKGCMTVDLSLKGINESGEWQGLGAGGVFVDYDSEWLKLVSLEMAGSEVPAPAKPTTPTSNPTPTAPDSPETGNASQTMWWIIAVMAAILALTLSANKAYTLKKNRL